MPAVEDTCSIHCSLKEATGAKGPIVILQEVSIHASAKEATYGAHVVHIQRDGKIEPHEDTEDRLLSKWGDGGDLFRTRKERLEVAYRLQARRLGVGK